MLSGLQFHECESLLAWVTPVGAEPQNYKCHPITFKILKILDLCLLLSCQKDQITFFFLIYSMENYKLTNLRKNIKQI